MYTLAPDESPTDIEGTILVLVLDRECIGQRRWRHQFIQKALRSERENMYLSVIWSDDRPELCEGYETPCLSIYRDGQLLGILEDFDPVEEELDRYFCS